MTFAFVVRPTRPTFPDDATVDEAAIIGAHFQYLKAAFDRGAVHLIGRCEDAAFGLTVFDAASLQEAESFALNDPAVRAGIFSKELREFRIVLKSG